MKLRKADAKTHKIVYFMCPGCEELHQVVVEGSEEYKGAVWEWNGDMDKPTFSPSLLVRVGHYIPGHGDTCWCSYNDEHPDNPAPFKCMVCHSFIREGKIEFLSDCTHKLAGQTVELPDIEV